MKAILTIYSGPTDSRGSRIKAFDEDKNSVSIGCDDRYNMDQLHRMAARALCKKMGWTGRLIEGQFKRFHIFVFRD